LIVRSEKNTNIWLLKGLEQQIERDRGWHRNVKEVAVHIVPTEEIKILPYYNLIG
jgi:hypothetical protein